MRRSVPRHVRFGLCLLALATLSAADEPSKGQVEEITETFRSHGKKITVDRFAQKTTDRRPVIVLLHGAGGIPDRDSGRVSHYRIAARALAQEGYVVVIPHYFDRTGTNFKDAERNRKHFEKWMETVADTVTYAGRLPNVDRRRVGLLGYSLGAGVVLSNGAADPRVGAVVEYYGSMLGDHLQQVTTMPPTLLLHGDADRNVPVREAYKVAEAFTARNIDFEIKIYQGAGHGFRADDAKDAWKRTVEFFEKHLKQP